MGPLLRVQQSSLGHWVIRGLWALAVIGFVLYIPTKTQTGTISDMTYALELATVVLSLNLLLGYAGAISIGHSAFYGIGGYTTAILVTRYGWSQGWTLPIAVAIAFVVGALLALPAMRLKGIYLALVTLAVGVLFPQFVKWGKLDWLTNGSVGLDGIQYKDMRSWIPFLGELRGREGRAVFMFWYAVVIVVIAYLVCRGIVKSRMGRSLIAMRDNETAAAVMGVNVAATKAVVFGISAALAALAGSVGTMRVNAIAPDYRTLTLLGSITFLLVMILGGAATLWGPILGSILYVYVENQTRSAGTGGGTGPIAWVQRTFFDWFTGSPATLILAAMLMIIIFVAPFGIVGLLRRVARALVVIVPTPAGSGVAPEVGQVLGPADGDVLGAEVDPLASDAALD